MLWFLAAQILLFADEDTLISSNEHLIRYIHPPSPLPRLIWGIKYEDAGTC